MSESNTTEKITFETSSPTSGTATVAEESTGGPRQEETTPVARKRSRMRGPALASRLAILIGTIAFAGSHFLRWWELRLNAPQFPGGLFIDANSHAILDSPKTPFDDIDQVDGLNHYIGMMTLDEAAKWEMKIAIPAAIIFTIMGLAAVFIPKWWGGLLSIPIVLFPFVYAADLQYWLWYAGNHLDPMAAITLDGFTPKVIGTGKIAQFSTDAMFQIGWFVALAAAILCLIGIILSIRRKGKA